MLVLQREVLIFLVRRTGHGKAGWKGNLIRISTDAEAACGGNNEIFTPRATSVEFHPARRRELSRNPLRPILVAAGAFFHAQTIFARLVTGSPCALANSLGRKINYQTRYADTAPHISRDSVKLSARQFRVPVPNGEIELLTVPHTPRPSPPPCRVYYALAQLSGRFKGIPLTRHVLSLILRNFCDIQPRVHRRRIRPISISIKFPYRRERPLASPLSLVPSRAHAK